MCRARVCVATTLVALQAILLVPLAASSSAKLSSAPSSSFCRHQISHQKITEKCAQEFPTITERVPCVRFLFVTGCGYSGTHFTSHAYGLNLDGVTASHEKAAFRTDIDVSWYGRYDVPWALGEVPVDSWYDKNSMGNFFKKQPGPQTASRECL